MRPLLSQSPNLNLMQKPEMQLALRLLEAPTLELAPILTQELEDNPLLEWEEHPLPQGPSPENLEAKPTLAEYLLAQLGEDRPLHTELLLGHLDSRGLITTPLEEIAWHDGIDVRELWEALEVLQTLEPNGICATSPQEALLNQLKTDTLAYEVIRDHYEDLIHRRVAKVAKALKLTTEELQTLVEREIAPLNPHPGSNFSHTQSPILTPDLWIVEEGDRLISSLKQIPSLQVVSNYRKMMEVGEIPAKTKRYLEQKLGRAKWVVKALEERGKTLVKLGELLIATQEPFLRDPQETLSPLTLTEAAAELGLHESTISRAVAHKTLAAPRGLLPLRHCFSHAVVDNTSAQALKEQLKQLIAAEETPHSDQVLSEKLGISRRTVTKYRQQLNIGNARERGRYGSSQSGSLG